MLQLLTDELSRKGERENERERESKTIAMRLRDRKDELRYFH